MRASIDIDNYFPPGVWLVPMLRAFTDINEAYLRSRLNTPDLYESGVFYREDPPGKEIWRDIPRILRVGHADCKKLAPWRAAELRVKKSIAATAIPVLQTMASGVILVHVIVELPDGRTEDPSRILGMGGFSSAPFERIETPSRIMQMHGKRNG